MPRVHTGVLGEFGVSWHEITLFVKDSYWVSQVTNYSVNVIAGEISQINVHNSDRKLSA